MNLSKISCSASNTALITDSGKLYVWGKANFGFIGLKLD